MKARKYSERKRLSEGKKLFLLALPFVIYIFLFSYVPLFGWSYAFFDYSPGKALLDCDFIGLRKFIELFTTGDILPVLRNTLVMSGINLLFTPLPVVLAIMVNEIRSTRYKKFIQTVTTLPNFISWIIVFSIAFAMFSSDGVITTLLLNMGIGNGESLLVNKNAAWIFQGLLSVWKTLGWNAIIYLATISGIDNELYDAAKVDGANRLQRIIHVTVPGLSTTYFVLLLLAISNILNNGFEQYFVFQNAMVSEKINVLDYYAYQVGFLTNDYPMSIAIGMFKTIVSILLLFLANKLSKAVRNESII